MNRDGIEYGVFGQDILQGCFALMLIPKNGRGLSGHLHPNGLAAGSECSMGDSHAQGFCDDLAGRSRSQELAATTG